MTVLAGLADPEGDLGGAGGGEGLGDRVGVAVIAPAADDDRKAGIWARSRWTR